MLLLAVGIGVFSAIMHQRKMQALAARIETSHSRSATRI